MLRPFAVRVLRAELAAAHRREQAYLRMIEQLNDRLAALYGKPWTLPPRPVEPIEELARSLGTERPELELEDV